MNFVHIQLILIISIFFQLSVEGKIRFVLTAALVQDYYELRKQQYIKSINALESFKIADIYIVDAISKEGPTFLEKHCQNVFYAQCNDNTLKNKGVNEAKTLLEALRFFNFDDNDLIIKLTGRYQFIDDSFLQFIKLNQDRYDGFFKPAFWAPGDVASLCFGMRNKYLKEMLENLNYRQMELEPKGLEYVIAEYLILLSVRTNFRLFFVEKFGIRADLQGSTNNPNLKNIIYC